MVRTYRGNVCTKYAHSSAYIIIHIRPSYNYPNISDCQTARHTYQTHISDCQTQVPDCRAQPIRRRSPTYQTARHKCRRSPTYQTARHKCQRSPTYQTARHKCQTKVPNLSDCQCPTKCPKLSDCQTHCAHVAQHIRLPDTT